MRIHIQVIDDETEVETEYVVHLELEQTGPDSGAWVLESIEPTPPNEFVEEQVMEVAAMKADEAIDDAMVELGEWKADTKECEWE